MMFSWTFDGPGEDLTSTDGLIDEDAAREIAEMRRLDAEGRAAMNFRCYGSEKQEGCDVPF